MDRMQKRSMANAMLHSHWMKICVIVLIASSFAADTPETAVKKVREGLQHFRASKFSDAESSFSDAQKVAPENAVILFDKACAAMAGGDPDQARGLFRSASLSKDPTLAVKAHYNLGCLEADVARSKLGEDPAAVEGDAREECVEVLRTSIRHYRDVLRLEPEHTDARHNLELLLLYIKHLQSQWTERDKQKDRNEKDLLQFLKMIEERQTQIRSVTKALAGEDGSAYLRQAAMESADALRTLQEEIGPLKQKVTEQIQAAQQSAAGQQQPSASTAGDEQLQQAEKMLHQAADDIGQKLLDAASSLDQTQFIQANEIQTDGLNNTNQLYMTIAPYQDVLQRALKQQQSLAPPPVKETEDGLPPDSDAAAINQPLENEASPKPDAIVSSDDSVVVEDSPVNMDPEKAIEDQTRVTEWSTVLKAKAEAELPQMQQQLDGLKQSTAQGTGEETEADPSTESEESEDEIRVQVDPKFQPPKNLPTDSDGELPEEESVAQAQQKQMQQQMQQLEGLVESMKLAVEKGPSAAQHSTSAVAELTGGNLPSAATEQSKTLEILKEIAEPLKSDQQDHQQQNDDQQDQDQDKDQQNKQDSEQQDQQQKKPSEQEQKEQQQQQEKQSDRQRAEAMLRQASERERKHREDQKKLRALIMQGIKVDRDW